MRDPKINKLIVRKGAGYAVTADIILELPVLFEDHGLILNGDDTAIVGSFAMIHGKNHAVSNIPTLLQITPDDTTVIVKHDVKYYNYIFNKGSTIFPTTEVLQRGGTIYSLLNLYLFHSNAPWFLTVSDLYKLLNNSSYYAGIGTDSTPEIIELFIALAARVKGELSVLYKNGKGKREVEWVSLADVTHLKSMMAMVTNNYQAKGLVQAMLSKPNEPSAIEKVVRA